MLDITALSVWKWPVATARLTYVRYYYSQCLEVTCSYSKAHIYVRYSVWK